MFSTRGRHLPCLPVPQGCSAATLAYELATAHIPFIMRVCSRNSSMGRAEGHHDIIGTPRRALCPPRPAPTCPSVCLMQARKANPLETGCGTPKL